MKRAQIAALLTLAVLALAPPIRASHAEAALGAQSRQKPCGIVTVAAASDLTDVMKEIGASFEKETGCTVRVSTGSSGNFLSQIENGAPFDLFFSADIEYPKK